MNFVSLVSQCFPRLRLGKQNSLFPSDQSLSVYCQADLLWEYGKSSTWKYPGSRPMGQISHEQSWSLRVGNVNFSTSNEKNETKKKQTRMSRWVQVTAPPVYHYLNVRCHSLTSYLCTGILYCTRHSTLCFSKLPYHSDQDVLRRFHIYR